MVYASKKINQGSDFKLLIERQLTSVTALGISGFGKEPRRTANYWMDQNVLSLGVALQGKANITPATWVGWMANTQMDEFTSAINIYFRSAWIAARAKNLFEDSIKAHYCRPIFFKVAPELKATTAATIM